MLGFLKALINPVGAALGAASQARANNRGNQFSGQMDLASLLLARDRTAGDLNAQADNDFFNQTVGREQENRVGRDDAWKKLLSAQRVTNPGAKPQLSPYSIAPRTPTHAEQTGATALSEEVRNRLINGNPMPEVTRRNVSIGDPLATVDPRLLKAGKGESVMGWLSALLGGGGPSSSSTSAAGNMRF